MRSGQATAELDHLRWNWAGAYEVTAAVGVWRAVRADNQVSLVAPSPAELRNEIVADYTHRSVPRP
jgi:hypothetical protein